MADLRGYLCWDAETASTTINTEAINPSPAVFLATHAPLRIRQARIQGRSLVPMDSTVDENVVLKDFLGRKSDTGTLLMPVVGDSGSGKSHLVRWVRENIPFSDRYRVIYLEKSRTSLKAVVHALLEGAEGEALRKLKSDIDSFSTGLDETGLARRLINALNEALAATTPKDMSGPTRILAGPKGLASILQDPYIQEHMLAPGKYIPQIASQLLHNRDANSPERPTGFTVDDLPLNVRDIQQAAHISQRLLQKLLSMPDLQTAAVDFLNQHLETAVQSASNLGAGRLHEAMLQVRQEYASRDKEIILLVEDFALIQGVQRELLEALTEAATREGRLRYAPMRTLMAVTTGYFRDLPETVMSRVSAATTGYVYDLDLVFSQEDNGTEQIASFVGRYLNAARVGHEELELFNGQHVPNRCEACPVKTQCHESFGHTEEGHGLYPFNRPALMRMVHSVAPADRPWAFIPRTVLGNVVRPVLVEYSAEIAETSFPDPRFKERFRTVLIDQPLTTAAAEVVNTHDHLDPDRHKQVLEFWGDAPSDPTAVDPGILHAFGLQPLPEEARQPGISKKTNTGAGVTRPPTVPDNSVPESLKRKIQAVENWAAREQVLPQPIANDLRRIIVDTVIRRYNWSSPLMKEMSKADITRAWPNNSTVVSIEGAGGENLPGTDKAPISFKRNALNSQFFQSLLLAKEGADGGRAEDIRRLAGFGEAKAKDLTAALERYFKTSDADLTVGLRASLLGAALAGKAWPSMDNAALLAAALDDGRTWKRGDQNLRTAQWRQLMERHLQHRVALVDRLRTSVGISQGSGAVRMIDAARALPLLRHAAADWTWSTEQPVPTWVKDAVFGFARLWDDCVDRQIRELTTILDSLRQRLPRDTSGRDTVDAVQLALKESEKVGLSPGLDERTGLNNLISEATKAEWQVVATLEKDLGKISVADEAESATARVRAAAHDHGESLEVIRKFLIAGDLWLTSALNDAAARSDSVGDAAALEVQSLLSEWASLSDLEGEGND